MNIYHVVLDRCGYDQYDSFVIIDESEDKALSQIKCHVEDQGLESICKIGVSDKSEAEIVLGSFNAG